MGVRGGRLARPCRALQAGLSSAISTLRARASYRTILSWGVTSSDDIHSLGAHPGKRCFNFLSSLPVESSPCCLTLIPHVSTFLLVGLGRRQEVLGLRLPRKL